MLPRRQILVLVGLVALLVSPTMEQVLAGELVSMLNFASTTQRLHMCLLLVLVEPQREVLH